MNESHLQRGLRFFLTAGAVMAILLGSGCAHPKLIEIAPTPQPVALTPSSERQSEVALRNDLGFLDQLEREVAQLANESPERAEAEVLLQAVRADYIAGGLDAWLDLTVLHIQSLVRESSPVGEAGSFGARRGYDRWATHVRSTRGFRAALPILIEAESLGGEGLSRPSSPDSRPVGWTSRMAAMQERLATLHHDRSISVRSYAWTKAQAWLDFAVDEHAIRDRSGVVDAALDQAERVIVALEMPVGSDRDLKLDEVVRANPPLGAAHRVNEPFQSDLWAIAASNRPADLSSRMEVRDPALATLARLEVALIHAAHEHGQLGRRASRPYHQAATRIAAEFSPKQ